MAQSINEGCTNRNDFEQASVINFDPTCSTNSLFYFSSGSIEINDGEIAQGGISEKHTILDKVDAKDFSLYSGLEVTWSYNADAIESEFYDSIWIYRAKAEDVVEISDSTIATNLTENMVHIATVAIDAPGFTYTDYDVESGKEYLYILRAFGYEQSAPVTTYRESEYIADYGSVMAFGLTASNKASDDMVLVEWEIDANCLIGDFDESVYFRILDDDTEEEIFVTHITDPSSFINSTKLNGEYQLMFEKEESYISIDPIADLGAGFRSYEYSFEAWIKIEELTQSKHLILTDDTENQQLYISNNTFFLKTEDGEIALGGTIDENTWTHVSLTAEPASGEQVFKLYLDGELVNTVSGIMPWEFTKIAGNGNGEQLNGAIADIRLWDHTRNSLEVKYNYYYPVLGSTTGLVALYSAKNYDSGNPLSLSNEVTSNASYVAGINYGNWTAFDNETDKNRLFVGSVIDFLGPDVSRNYRLQITEYGSSEPVCVTLRATGSTSTLYDGDLMATSNDPGKVTLTWSDSSDVTDQYIIYRNNSEIARTRSTSYEDYQSSGLWMGEENTYTVKRYNARHDEIYDLDETTGALFDMDITASYKDGTVILDWTNLTSDDNDTLVIDTLAVYYNGSQLTLLSSTIDTYEYTFPIHGDLETYKIAGIKNGEIYGYDELEIDVPKIGSISGYLVSDLAETIRRGRRRPNLNVADTLRPWALENTRIIASATLDDVVYSDTTTTDFEGSFKFDQLYFGATGVTYTIRVADYDYELLDNEFYVSLDTPSRNDVLVLVDESFNAVADLPVVYDPLSLGVNENATSVEIFFNLKSNVIPNDQVVFYIQRKLPEQTEEEWELLALISEWSNYYLDGSNDSNYPERLRFFDEEVAPNTTYDYKLITATFTHEEVNYNETVITDVTTESLPTPSSFSVATTSNGEVKFNLGTSSYDFNQFLITRIVEGSSEEEEIAHLERRDRSLTWSDFLPNEKATYYLYTTSKYSEEKSTKLEYVDFITPVLPVPEFDLTKSKSNSDKAFELVWKHQVNEADISLSKYNFDGYQIYRVSSVNDTVLVSDIRKEAVYSGLVYVDNTLSFGESYDYHIRAYRNTALQDDPIVSEFNTTPLSNVGINYSSSDLMVTAVFDPTTGNDNVVNVNWDFAYQNNLGVNEAAQLERIEISSTKRDTVVVANWYTGNFDYQFKDGLTGIGSNVSEVQYILTFASEKLPTDISKTSNQLILSGTSTTYVDPTGFTATKNLEGMIELTWNHRIDHLARFVISRDGVVLDTLPTQYRNYLDDQIEAGASYIYELCAVYEDPNTGAIQKSKNYAAVGSSSGHFQMEGIVVDADGVAPVMGVDVMALLYVNGEVVQRKNTASDQKGYFLFKDFNDGSVTGKSEVDSIVILLEKDNYNIAGDVYDANALSSSLYQLQAQYQNTIHYPVERIDHSIPAEVVALSVNAIEEENAVKIDWMTTTENYTGFILFRDFNAIEKIELLEGQPLEFLDKTGLPGESYTYGIQPYTEIPNGQDHYGDTLLYDHSVIYPGICNISSFYATAVQDSNEVRLSWTYSGIADEFHLYRSGDIIAAISADEPNRFVDSTAVPGINYVYKLIGYNRTSNSFSQEATVTTTYPNLQVVQDFAATSSDQNVVNLTWTYPAGHIDGYKIERNGKLLAQLESETLAFTDTSGIPESWHEYTIYAYREDAFDKYYSSTVTDTATFPQLAAVKDLQVGTENSVAKLSWTYDYEYIDGFILYRDGQYLTELTPDITSYIDSEGKPGQSYTYQVKVLDFRDEAQSVYYSDEKNVALASYPNFPTLGTISSSGNSKHHLGAKWTYNWEYINGFIVYVNNAAVDTLESWERDYYHIDNDGSSCGATRSVKVVPFRYIDGNVITNSTANRSANISFGSCGSAIDMISNLNAETNYSVVKLSWQFNSDKDLDEVRIFRNGEYIGLTNGTSYEFYDSEAAINTLNLYEVVPYKNSSVNGAKAVASAYAYALNSVTGLVATANGNLPVEGAEVKLTHTDDNNITYSYVTATNNVGGYDFNQIYFNEEDSVDYTITASYNDHRLINTPQTFTVTESGVHTAATIYDLDGKSISGMVTKAITGCPVEGATVTLHYKDVLGNDVKASEQSVTDGTGFYSFVPLSMEGLEYYIIDISDQDQENGTEGYFSFNVAPDTLLAALFMDKAEFSYVDSTTYDFAINVVNGCHGSLGTYNFEVLVESKEGCMYEKYNTNLNGLLQLSLPVGEYSLRVSGAEPLDPISQSVVDYFATRPQQINVTDIHESILSGEREFVGEEDSVKYFEFHVIPEILTLEVNGFEDVIDEFNLTNTTPEQIPDWLNVLVQGNDYEFNFQIEEQINTNTCVLDYGTVVVRNAAANAEKANIELQAGPDGLFNYTFTAENINPAVPYLQGMFVEYYSKEGEFLTAIAYPVLVTGTAAAAGRDILVSVDTTDNGEIQIPLFVLRDPPGDGSYSYVEKDVTISKYYEASTDDMHWEQWFEKVQGASDLDDHDDFIPENSTEMTSMYGDFAEISSNENDAYGIHLSLKTTERFETSKSPTKTVKNDGYLDFHEEDVIVGMGVAMTYGVAKEITILEEEGGGATVAELLSYDIAGSEITTQWSYTIDHIRQTVFEYDSLLNNPNVILSDDDREIFEVTRDNWEAIDIYVNRDAIPMYAICKELLQDNLVEDQGFDELTTFCEAHWGNWTDDDSLNVYTPYNEDLDAEYGWTDLLTEQYENYINNVALEQQQAFEYTLLSEVFSEVKLDEDYQNEIIDEHPGNDSQNYNYESANVSLKDDIITDAVVVEEIQDNIEALMEVFREQYQGAGIDNKTFTGGAGANTNQIVSKWGTKNTFTQKWRTKEMEYGARKSEFFIKTKYAADLSYKIGLQFRAKTTTIALGTEVTPAGIKWAKNFDLGIKTGIEMETRTRVIEEDRETHYDEITLTEKESVTLDSAYTIGYVLDDDDNGDLYSVMVVKGTNQGHTPYFDLLGGRTACPYVIGTAKRDDFTAGYASSDTSVASNVIYDVEPDKKAILHFSVGNGSYITTDRRYFTIEPIAGENKNHASLTYEKNPIGLDAGEAYYGTILVERVDPFYDFTDLKFVVKPECGDGAYEADTLEYEVYFNKPCSPVSIYVPESDFVVNYDDEGNELLTIKVTDYEVDGLYHYTEGLTLEYRREGTEEWTEIESVAVDSLSNYFELMKLTYPMPTYPFIWNIHEDESIIDGNYEIKITAECGEYGNSEYDIISGTIDRSTIQLVGDEAPKDGILSIGDVISIEFNKDLDCYLMDSSLITITDTALNSIEFEVICSGSGLEFIIEETLLDSLNDQLLTVNIDSAALVDYQGNSNLERFTWDFKVNYSPVYFSSNEIEFFMDMNTTHQVEVTLKSNLDQIEYFSLSGYDTTWISLSNQNNILLENNAQQQFRNGERDMYLNFNSFQKEAGTYRDTVYAKVDGFEATALYLTVHLNSEVSNWSVNPSDYESSMEMISLLGFAEDALSNMVLSADTNDVVAAVIDNEIRGIAQWSKLDDVSNDRLYLTVFGNADDHGKAVDFRVLDASNGYEYDAYNTNGLVTFQSDTLYGRTGTPDTLRVNKSEGRARYIHLSSGWNMISLNAQPKDASVESIFLGYPLVEGDQVKDKNNFTQFDGKNWLVSNLDSLKGGQGYWVYVQNEGSIRFTGSYQSGDITRNFLLDKPSGWYLIGSPIQDEQHINEVLGFIGDIPTEGILKTQNQFATFEAGTWKGQLTYMQPFKAYQIQLNAQSIMTFGTDIQELWPEKDNRYESESNARKVQKWSVESSQFEHSASLIAKMHDLPIEEGDQLIISGQNDELYGVLDAVFDAVNQETYFSGLIYGGNAEEELIVKYYQSSTNTIIGTTEDFSYQTNKRSGSVDNPVLFNLNNEDKQLLEERINLYPNPVETDFVLQLDMQEEDLVTISISSISGVKYLELNTTVFLGANEIEIDLSDYDLGTGIYVVNVVGVKTGTKYKKFVIK
ncbi:LamG-like jellyroll fold domain-containing protein [Flammeovirga sp. EKP202]|uniref:LamG-like jellyroll fold domain-containing protein n=1 Tax=Flammeovirga sp. EKP202 TaxID=2770592 RepID=UPI00165EE9CE|nr:LamG-like jellyroll fold domain-containing protein [Flammeovirga sp. EKP202]MBD0401804.1 hypothetical protein [Flammeovirga sp. EKP202]